MDTPATFGSVLQDTWRKAKANFSIHLVNDHKMSPRRAWACIARAERELFWGRVEEEFDDAKDRAARHEERKGDWLKAKGALVLYPFRNMGYSNVEKQQILRTKLLPIFTDVLKACTDEELASRDMEVLDETVATEAEIRTKERAEKETLSALVQVDESVIKLMVARLSARQILIVADILREAAAMAAGEGGSLVERLSLRYDYPDGRFRISASKLDGLCQILNLKVPTELRRMSNSSDLAFEERAFRQGFVVIED